jgi:2-amino-4-hydroxy-6-hydroxymethyldihydropteridine diphosphokinase
LLESLKNFFSSVGRGFGLSSGKSGGSSGWEIGYISLGGNLGDSNSYIHRSLERLDRTEGLAVLQVSRFVKTAALTFGGKEGPDYLNAVAQIRTRLGPERLLTVMQGIEDSLGRTRGEKWAPRTIDLDLILYGDRVVERANLKVPHEQMHLRSFVLDGVADLDSEVVHPLMGVSVRELSGRLNGGNFVRPFDRGRPGVLEIAGIIGSGKTTLASNLSKFTGWEIFAEAYRDNPYLKEAYKGQQDKALDAQLYFLNSRVGQLDKERLEAGRIYVTDYLFAKESIFAELTLDEYQKRVYFEEYKRKKERVCRAGVVIYIDVDEVECLERIGRRGREFEKSIGIDMLKRLRRSYNELFEIWDECPVIRLGGDFDCRRKKDVRRLERQLRFYL